MIKPPPPLPTDDQQVVNAAEEALLDAAFWSRRPVLEHVEGFARGRRVPPWSMFGAVLVRALAHVPPSVVLPALIGSRTSLNFFCAIVGPPGAGKDASDDAAADAFTWGKSANPSADFFATSPVIAPLGTGEGVARTYRPIGTKADMPNPVASAIFSASEIDHWAAIEGRTGSTLTPTLRGIFGGKQFGFANAGRDTRVIVEAHSYRACLFIGVQPLKSAPLLRAADGGLPQRFCWFSTRDVEAPDNPPPTPQPLPDPCPDWDTAEDVDHAEDVVTGKQLTVLRVPDAARREIDAHRVAVLRGDPDVDALDGHALVVRLKVSVGLAVLETRTAVTDEDWQLAGVVMDVSRMVRDHCQVALDDQAKRTNWARGADQAERAQMVTDRLTDAAQKRAAKAIVSKLKRVERATRHELRRACAAAIRDEFDPVFDLMVDQGFIVATASEGGGFTATFEFGTEHSGEV